MTESFQQAWEGFRDEVLERGWPDKAVLICDLAFTAGVVWVLHRLAEDSSEESRLALLEELEAHEGQMIERWPR